MGVAPAPRLALLGEAAAVMPPVTIPTRPLLAFGAEVLRKTYENNGWGLGGRFCEQIDHEDHERMEREQIDIEYQEQMDRRGEGREAGTYRREGGRDCG